LPWRVGVGQSRCFPAVISRLSFNITDKIAFNVGYRIWSCLDAEFDDDFRDDEDDDEDFEGDMSIPFFHTVKIGVRYTF